MSEVLILDTYETFALKMIFKDLREVHGEDTIGVLLKLGAQRYCNVNELAEKLDANQKG